MTQAESEPDGQPIAIEQVYHYCPRCGEENPKVGDVPFRCGTCQLVSFFGPVAAVGAIVVNGQGQILLVRRARDPGKGRWGLPGGFVDRNETVEAALAREVKEETQLVITSSELLMTHPNDYNYRGVVAPVIDLFYCCQVESTDEVTLAPEELEHHAWVRPTAEHLDKMAFHSNRVAIERFLAKAAQ